MPHYYNTSSSSNKLPGDEFRQLQRQQDYERLTSHFAHSGRPSTSYHRPNAYRDIGMSYEDRFQASKVRNATRAALGPSFDSNDDSYTRSRSHTHNYDKAYGWTDDYAGSRTTERIPQKYLDEFNQRWHEDDENRDAGRYQADHMVDAPWRGPARFDELPMPIQPDARRRRPEAWRCDSGIALSSRSGASSRPSTSHQTLKSRFSFDEDVPELPKKSRNPFKRW